MRPSIAWLNQKINRGLAIFLKPFQIFGRNEKKLNYRCVAVFAVFAVLLCLGQNPKNLKGILPPHCLPENGRK
jgi:hypothetical protein